MDRPSSALEQNASGLQDAITHARGDEGAVRLHSSGCDGAVETGGPSGPPPADAEPPTPLCVLATDTAYNRLLDLIGSRPPRGVVGGRRHAPPRAGPPRRLSGARRTGLRRRSKVRPVGTRPESRGINAHTEVVRRAAEVLLERYLDEKEDGATRGGKPACFLSILRSHRRWYRRNYAARGDLVLTMLRTVAKARADALITRRINAWYAVTENREEQRQLARVMTAFVARQKWFQESAWEDEEDPG
ncbi:MAG: hypothetical protein EXR69_05590 [Myxococcales bacterium]|nr:hypothetical protein [Myxococcales bacterium]